MSSPLSSLLDGPAEPWLSFLNALDQELEHEVDFHSMGGFVVSQCYGFGRETADLDILTAVPSRIPERVLRLAGKGSDLHRKHRVYVDPVSVAAYPDQYENRLTQAFALWTKVRLWVLEPHDLALTKLQRSNERDIRDVLFLANAGLIQRDTLESRYEVELQPYLNHPTRTWHRTTLQMWIDSCWPS